MPRSFSKIEQQLWRDPDFYTLSDDGKMLWLYLLTSPLSTFAPGILVGSVLNVGEDLRWIDDADYAGSIQRIDAAFQELEQLQWVELDRKARVIWIPNAVRKNPPRNENVTRGWLRAMLEVPRSPLRMKWLRRAASDLKQRYGRSTAGQRCIKDVSPVYQKCISGVSKVYHEPVSGVITSGSGKGQLLVNVASKLDQHGVNDQKLNEFIEEVLLMTRQSGANGANNGGNNEQATRPSTPPLDPDYIDIDIDREIEIETLPSYGAPPGAPPPQNVGTKQSRGTDPGGTSTPPPAGQGSSDGNAASQRTIHEGGEPPPDEPPTAPHRKLPSRPPPEPLPPKKRKRKPPVPPEEKPDAPPASFAPRELAMWEALRKATFYVPGRGELTGWEAVDDPVRLAMQLGGEAFPNCGPDLIHRLATWTMENRNRAKQKVNRFLVNRFSAHQDKGTGMNRTPPWQQPTTKYQHGDDLEAKVRATREGKP